MQADVAGIHQPERIAAGSELLGAVLGEAVPFVAGEDGRGCAVLGVPGHPLGRFAGVKGNGPQGQI